MHKASLRQTTGVLFARRVSGDEGMAWRACQDVKDQHLVPLHSTRLSTSRLCREPLHHLDSACPREQRKIIGKGDLQSLPSYGRSSSSFLVVPAWQSDFWCRRAVCTCSLRPATLSAESGITLRPVAFTSEHVTCLPACCSSVMRWSIENPIRQFFN